MADEVFYNQLDGPEGRDASLAGGYWDENGSEFGLEEGDTTFAGKPIVPARFFGPDYATGDRTPGQTAVVDLS